MDVIIKKLEFISMKIEYENEICYSLPVYIYIYKFKFKVLKKIKKILLYH